MTETKINIGKETAALLQKLGLEPPFVKELHLTPTQATVTVFKKNEDGQKYLEETREYLPPLDPEDTDVSSFETTIATETLTFAVRT